MIRKQRPPSSPALSDSHELYKRVQKGEDIPFHGLRLPAPERKEKGWHSVEDVSHQCRDCGHTAVEELVHRKEALKKFYQEEKRKKQREAEALRRARCHSDNLLPRQKVQITNDRFEDIVVVPPKQRNIRGVAKAKYEFVPKYERELPLRRGDIVYLIRQVDKNWYVGESHGMIGMFPINYVQMFQEGLAKAAYPFSAQSSLELSFDKGELITILRRVDINWYEGMIAGVIGIFPVSYVDVINEPETTCLTPFSSTVPSRSNTPDVL